MQSLFQYDLFLQVRGLTPDRAAILLPAALGLISVITGWLALARSKRRTGSVRLTAVIALATASIDIVLSGLHLIRTTGDIGTGSGKLGAIVALVLGLTGVLLGSLALSRARTKMINDSAS